MAFSASICAITFFVMTSNDDGNVSAAIPTGATLPPMTFFVLLVAILAGIAVALQGQFIGAMDRTAGSVTSVFVTYGLGGLLAAILWLAARPPLAALRRIPWYAWTAGVFGLVIVGGIGYAAPRLGLSRTLVLTVAAQLAAAVVIDHFGLLGATPRSLDASRAAGLAVTVAGVWLVVRGG